MKTFTCTFLLVLASIVTFGQSKFKTGVYAEGGYFFPKASYSEWNVNNNLATGIGVFGSYDLLKRFSLSLGAGYRYKLNDFNTRKYYQSSGYSGYGYYGYGQVPGYQYNYDSDTEGVKRTYKQHYLAVPLKLRYLLTKKLFVEAGVEAAWLLNYDKYSKDKLSDDPNASYQSFRSETTEFDWIVGVGYQFTPRLNAAINYTQGFDDQSMGEIRNLENFHAQRYKNRMLTLNVSYAIFGGK